MFFISSWGSAYFSASGGCGKTFFFQGVREPLQMSLQQSPAPWVLNRNTRILVLKSTFLPSGPQLKMNWSYESKAILGRWSWNNNAHEHNLFLGIKIQLRFTSAESSGIQGAPFICFLSLEWIWGSLIYMESGKLKASCQHHKFPACSVTYRGIH